MSRKHGNDGTSNVPLLTSATGALSITSASLPLPTGAATEATLLLLNTDSLTVVGSGVEATALRVTVATDCSVSTASKSIGTLGNASNAITTVGTLNKSTAIDISQNFQCQLMCTVDIACTITIEVSQDGSKWFATFTQLTAPSAGDYETSFATAAKYVRCSYDVDALTVTSTIAGK